MPLVVHQEGTIARTSPLMLARALAELVERLSTRTLPAGGVPVASPGESRDAVRKALRSLAGAARNDALHCHVDELGLHVNDQLVLPSDLRAEPKLYNLARRIVNHEVGTLSIREGASPSELLTLGRLLAESPRKMSEGLEGNSSGESSRQTPTNFLQSWSVLVTPASTPLFSQRPVSPPVGSAMTRLRASRTDDAARQAVADLLDLASDAEGRGDAAAVEAIAVALAQHAHTIGAGEGRLATEGGLRRLLRDGIVRLLAVRIPESANRDLLISILSRAGEMGGRALVDQLMAADDGAARRSYFDAIVTQDSGVMQLRDAVNDSRWYVVRNAAALLGEMGMAESDASLIPLLSHLDARIRIAAARALSRLRTQRGLAALQQRLSDENAEVRRLAAAAFALSTALAGAKPHSALLGAALAVEGEEDVAFEMLASLGKLASADAVQRLLRMAMRTGGRAEYAGWFRTAALEALVAARGHAAVPTLEVLTADEDEEVASAARRLLGNVLTR